MGKRTVSFSLFLKLIFERKVFAFVGLIFFLSAIGSLILLNIIGNTDKGKYDNYDYENIYLLGTEASATLNKIDVKTNVSYNNINPVVLFYQYNNNGKLVNDEFETVDIQNVSHLNIGDNIPIKYYQNQSALVGVEPFTFPLMLLFYIIPFVFGCLGIIFMLISILPALKKIQLYKNGNIKDAEIIGLNVGNTYISNSGETIYNSGAMSVTVLYFYYMRNGKKKSNQAQTKDYNYITDYKVGIR